MGKEEVAGSRGAGNDSILRDVGDGGFFFFLILCLFTFRFSFLRMF